MYTQEDKASNISTILWIVGIILVIGAIILVSSGAIHKDYSFEEEERVCKGSAKATFEARDTQGYCDTYIGSDGELHYKYVVVYPDEKVEKDVYTIWETMKTGKY